MAKKETIDKKPAKASCFTFGEPEETHANNFLDYLGVFASDGGEYYVPPINLSGLSKMKRANGHHGSCVVFRRNMMINAYKGSGLRKFHLKSITTDLITFGNAYIQVLRNRLGMATGLTHVSALNMRVKTSGGFRLLKPNGDFIDFGSDEIIHLKEYDTQQDIYGVPDWIGGLQSALLNESATLFRRKYYVNGAHLGYILYTSDAKMSPAVVKKIQDSVTKGKGIGNFKSMHLHIPKGEEKGVQIIPIGDIGQKDEFKNIKNISAADVRESHRVPPVLMGIVPEGTTSLGDPIKVEAVYIRTEVQSLAQNFIDLNDILPTKLQFKFDFTTPNSEDKK